MEKLYRVVIANYAIEKRKPLKCALKFEETTECALIMFIGLALRRFKIDKVSHFLNTDIDSVYDYQDKFSKKKGMRFNTKLGLIENGMKL